MIRYVRNPEKTTEEIRRQLHEVSDVIDYAADEMKTERCTFVTGINLNSVETAAEEFLETKRMFRKMGGRVAFHGYQSFKEGEVDAETAHKIGVALATELWGDRFQVIVATHCNTGHYHSHFVINSVSDVDGRRFDNSHADYRRMREVSDRLCKEYGVSVITEAKCKGKNYRQYLAEKQGKPTKQGMIRADIDRAIKASVTDRDFIRVMEQLGYTFKIYGKSGSVLRHPAVKPEGSDRYARLDNLGEGYSLEEILRRVYRNNRIVKPFEEPTITRRTRRFKGRFPAAKRKHGLQALYFHYCCLLHIQIKHPSMNRRVHPSVWEDIIKLERINEQTRLLAANSIQTAEQLQAFRDSTEARMKALNIQRNDLRNAQKRNNRAGIMEPETAEQIAGISAALRKLRRQRWLCDGIAERSGTILQNYKEMKAEKTNIRKEMDKRSDWNFRAYCASYLLCKQFGVPTEDFDQSRAKAEFADRNSGETVAELEKIRDAAGDISRGMEQALGNRQQEHTAQSKQSR